MTDTTLVLPPSRHEDREPPLSQEQIDSYRLSIRTAQQKCITGIVDLGKLLLQIKRQVPHGQFRKLFMGDNAPFGPRTATALMSIAEHSVLSNRQHASVLPASWSCLSMLTRLSDQRLQWLIETGRVHAGLQRNDVESLLRQEESRERRSHSMRTPSDDGEQPLELNPVERDRFLPTLQNYTPPAGDTLRQLKRVLVDIRDGQEEIRCDASYRREFRKAADDILRIVDGDPVPEEERS